MKESKMWKPDRVSLARRKNNIKKSEIMVGGCYSNGKGRIRLAVMMKPPP